MAEVDANIIGFPEINYFKQYFLKKVEGTIYEKIFSKIDFGGPHDETSFIHLFYIPPSEHRGSVPDSTLFNKDTLTELLDVIYKMPDVSKDLDAAIDFNMLKESTRKLKLRSNSQTYFLGLYAKYILDKTAQRIEEGGDQLTTLITQLSVSGITEGVAFLSETLPAVIYGNMQASINSKTCEENVGKFWREADEETRIQLCEHEELNMVTPESYVFYTSLYLNNDQEKKETIMKKTTLNELDVEAFMKKDSQFER